MDSNQIALICKFLWSFVWTTPLCKNAQTISWCQWVWDGGGENDCHLCCYVSCTFLHLTADCDGWEKTDPGDSLDGGEGEGWWHVCKQERVTLRSWTNCGSKYENQTPVFSDSVFLWESKSVTCEFHWAMKIFHLVKVWERKHWDEVRLWLASPFGPGPARYWLLVTLRDASLLENSFSACTGPLTAPRARTTSLESGAYNAHRAETAH